MATVLDGRGEGDNIDLVAEALFRTGYIERLCKTKRFQPFMKATVRSSLKVTQLRLRIPKGATCFRRFQ
eukprot:4629369-Prymnesium_polylepis.1